MIKLDEVQKILDEQYPELHMEARLDRISHDIIICFLNLTSNICLGPGDSTSVIPVRILDMLKDLRKMIELDIERLEK